MSLKDKLTDREFFSLWWLTHGMEYVSWLGGIMVGVSSKQFYEWHAQGLINSKHRTSSPFRLTDKAIQLIKGE
jgi:hypothetical protein